jgi:hypothetical protein
LWANPPLTPTKKRQQQIFGLLLFVGIGFFHVGYYWRDSQANEQIAPYGVVNNTFYVWYNTKYLTAYEDSYKVMLILRLDNFPPKDRMTDKNIEKSEPFTIQNGPVFLNHPYSGTLKFIRNGRVNNLEYNVVLVPSSIDPSAIANLYDAVKQGGKILMKRIQGLPWY